jgi:hypothetical protein
MVKTSYQCLLKSKQLSKSELELHHCFKRQKGRNKGRVCKYLVNI